MFMVEILHLWTATTIPPIVIAYSQRRHSPHLSVIKWPVNEGMIHTSHPMMQSSLSQNNAGGSVEASPPIFKTLRLLSGRYLHMLWSGSATTHEDEMDDDITAAGDERKYNDNCSVGGETFISVPQGSGETLSDIRSRQDSNIDASEGETPSGIRSRQDSDIDASEGETAFQRSQSPVTAALAALTRHCPPQLGRKTKTKRLYSSLEQEDSPKIARKRRQLTGLGRPRQDDVLLAWLTHALAPSDVRSDRHAQDQKIDEDSCNSKVVNTSPKSVCHVSVKRRGMDYSSFAYESDI
ncbi:hypothetical protein C8R48DRAFT_688455 [Suillus tomentosus]|nr:hypothetical protein C8R48DRAFT_688455 [Suillus tomentosus]